MAALRRRAAAAAVLLPLLLVGSCGGGPSLENQGAVTAPPGDSKHLTIGTAGFTESDLLAQMYALLLKQAGYRTKILSVANRELYEPALESGQIDVVPEYAATFADWLNAKTNGAKAPPVGSPDLDATMKALNAFAVTTAYAKQHRLKTLSDLGASGLGVRLAAGDECVRRPYCEPGLKKTYGIDVTGVDPKGVGTTQSKKAVQDGKSQMMLTTTTDATLSDFGLVLLADDKRLQNADYIVPVVNRARAGSERVADALGALNSVLTTQDLASMNQQVDSWRRLPEDVARSYLESKGLLKRSTTRS
ncbi:ABC transporter substrate-binding protein [Streptomyces sp. NPDC057684]|uniref:ABC transporter substrate-binding protein n=1 Tax=Streptomyces sp. NPDC057684 TaxID=3346211 RepID=UPI003699A241